MAPYRQDARFGETPAVQEGGVVDEIIDQFADRFAFLRELVQNAIDAETKSIDVSLRYERGEGVLTAGVTDRGVGMSKETMEEDLLVLFRSSKENDDSKIGKFGIGFASVLSVSPRVVRVMSSHEGKRHVLHLYPDLSYELFLSGRSQSSGTTVELEIEMLPETVDSFMLSAWQALSRWCRHARTEIRLRATDSHGNATIEERIDAPLGFARSLVHHEHRDDDGLNIVLALREEPGEYLAFFNSGLLLYETDESPLGSVVCKIQDPKLGHTLSRDNVRRDARYRHVLAVASALAGGELPARVGEALTSMVEAGNLGEYETLLDRASEAGLVGSGTKDWPVPLLHSIGDRSSVAASQLTDHYYALSRSPLTKALARRSIAVANLCDEAGTGELRRRSALEALCGEPLTDVHDQLTLVVPESGHEALAATIIELLDECYRPPRDIFIATISGAGANRRLLSGCPDRAFLGPTEDGGDWVLDEHDRPALSRFRRRGLILNAGHPWIRAALQLSAQSPATAARWLVRLILLDNEALTAERSRNLLEAR